ncbi:hypothetical protein IC229_10215 [Spirosoma sp. BT702]|uniref:Nuclear transport factor 2 family protein n=1 Tax=Spirosoma profusum TaxID=2771354 RepID=A0A927AN31_9BACT|nr:hypothetical protein [Spirosoma profusum]MBD2701009.1 hypothetical protein [Spirosoma profusum]
MKTNLLACLLLCSALSMQAQDFRALPPDQQPNAAELVYFGGNNPNLFVSPISDSAAISLVTCFLNELSSHQLEAAHRRLAEGFVVYGSGYTDKLETHNLNSLLNLWERTGKLFTDQHLTIETTATTVVPNGENRGRWVYVKGVWSARDKAVEGKSIRVPFYQLARINHSLIEQILISYGTDQLFYDLGYRLYTGPDSVVQRR